VAQAYKLAIYQPRIKARLHHALPMAIVPEQDSLFDEWFYSNYIQLSCEPGKYGINQLNFHETYLWNHKYPHFQVISLTRHDMQVFQDDLTELVTRAISNGFYFHCYVDEYYTTLEFQDKLHIIRDILVYGYDLSEGIVHVAGYRKDHQFGIERMPISSFVESFNMVGDHESWAHDVYIYKRRTDIGYHFDKTNVMEQLDDYIQSRNSSERMRGIANPHPFYYGADAVRTYFTNIEDSEISGKLSQVPLYTLWEHKKIMHQRIGFLANHTEPPIRDELLPIASEYSTIVRMLESKKLLLMKYNITLDRRYIQRLKEDTEALIAMETAVLSKFLDVVGQISGLRVRNEVIPVE